MDAACETPLLWYYQITPRRAARSSDAARRMNSAASGLNALT
jgi:hypothetical protein